MSAMSTWAPIKFANLMLQSQNMIASYVSLQFIMPNI